MTAGMEVWEEIFVSAGRREQTLKLRNHRSLCSLRTSGRSWGDVGSWDDEVMIGVGVSKGQEKGTRTRIPCHPVYIRWDNAF